MRDSHKTTSAHVLLNRGMAGSTAFISRRSALCPHAGTRSLGSGWCGLSEAPSGTPATSVERARGRTLEVATGLVVTSVDHCYKDATTQGHEVLSCYQPGS